MFRTLGSRVVLADRVRDNLIMDSGVSAESTPPHAVRVVFRARAADYPGDSEEQMFQRARKLGVQQLGDGYAEAECAVVPVEQPDSPGQRLDTWYEVTFERSELTLDGLVGSLRLALGVKKNA